MSTVNWPKISDDARVQQVYEESREAGSSHKLAEMLALRQGPSLSTDTRFLARFGPEPKHYISQLAKFRGDPDAWIGSRADIRRKCEERGLGCEGAVNVKERELPPAPPPIPVASDIVAREVRKTIAEVGEKPTPKERAELTEQTTRRLTGNVD